MASSGAKRKWRSIAAAPSSRLSNASQPSAERGREADRRPERIAPADALGEGQDPGLVDAELDRLFGRGGERDRPGHRDRRRRASSSHCSAERGVQHRLGGGEGLGRDRDQGRVRIEAGDRLLERGAVDVGDDRRLVAAGLAAERVDQQLRARAPSRRCRYGGCGGPGRTPRPRSRRSGRASGRAGRRRGRRCPARPARARRYARRRGPRSG